MLSITPSFKFHKYVQCRIAYHLLHLYISALSGKLLKQFVGASLKHLLPMLHVMSPMNTINGTNPTKHTLPHFPPPRPTIHEVEWCLHVSWCTFWLVHPITSHSIDNIHLAHDECLATAWVDNLRVFVRIPFPGPDLALATHHHHTCAPYTRRSGSPPPATHRTRL